MTVNRKLLFSIIVSVLCIGTIGAVGYITIAQQVETVEKVSLVKLAQDIKIEALEHRRYEKDFFLNIGNLEKQENYLKKFKATANSLKEKLNQLAGMEGAYLTAEIKETIAFAKTNYDSYLRGFFEVTAEVQKDPDINPQKANKLMTPIKQNIYNFEEGIQAIVENSTSLSDKAAAEIRESGRRTKNLLMVLFVLGVILTATVGIFIRRSIKASIARVSGRLLDCSADVGTASGQLASASQQVAEGTSEQAASIEESSSSLEEMASMTKQNANNAKQADDLMNSANEVVSQANQSMNHLTASMEEIAKASAETSKIIKTIDEIAFQTNLLALNAAVEAAKAGEAGAGFTVVADEVRNLAMRAANAARDTAQLIEGTVSKVEEGTDLVAKTSNDFASVAESSNKVGELISEIAAASNEQAHGIDQVNTAVVEMDKVTQQNAANAQELASASETMNLQAGEMRSAVKELLALFSKKALNAEAAASALTSAQKWTETVHDLPKKSAPIRKINRDAIADMKPQQVIPLDEDDFRDF